MKRYVIRFYNLNEYICIYIHVKYSYNSAHISYVCVYIYIKCIYLNLQD